MIRSRAVFGALLAAFAAGSACAIVVVPHISVVPHIVPPTARPVFARPAPHIEPAIRPPARAAIVVPGAAHAARPAASKEAGKR